MIITITKWVQVTSFWHVKKTNKINRKVNEIVFKKKF